MMKRPHIMHVIDSLAIGGAERMLVEIANHTDSGSFQVSVCVTRMNGALAGKLRRDIPIFVLGRKYRLDIQGILKFKKLIREQSVDLFHAHGRSTFSFLAVFRGLGWFRTPILLHDHYWFENKTAPTWMRFLIYNHCAKYVGVDRRHAQWASWCGLDDSKISIIPNALSPFNKVNLYNRASIDSNNQGKLTGIWIGNIRPEKGFHHLLEIIRRIPDETFCIRVIGNIADPEYFNQLNWNSNRIEWLGQKIDIEEELSRVDFGLMTSELESGPLVLIEYLMAGLPVIAFRVGEIGQQAAEYGVPGIVEPGDIEGFIKKFRGLLKMSPEERARIGDIGRSIAQCHFNMLNVIEKWHEIYNEIIHNEYH